MEYGRDSHRIDQVLASYGAEAERWPAADRAAVSTSSSPLQDEAREIDKVLALASVPAVPDGAVGRLMANLAAPPTAGVVLLRPKPRTPKGVFRLAAVLPLAASLALGIYLGATGMLDSFLPTTVTGDVAVNTTENAYDDLGGVGEADAYAEENLT
jgi:hypothetical protein